MQHTRIPWSTGTWTHEPVAVRTDATDLVVEAHEGSDAWRHTSYGFVHDSEHALLAPLAPGSAAGRRGDGGLLGLVGRAGARLDRASRAPARVLGRSGLLRSDPVRARGPVPRVVGDRGGCDAAPGGVTGVRTIFPISYGGSDARSRTS